MTMITMIMPAVSGPDKVIVWDYFVNSSAWVEQVWIMESRRTVGLVYFSIRNGDLIDRVRKELEVGRANACSFCLWIFIVVAVG